MTIPIWTSRYQAQAEIIASELTPVGITLGEPKFPLRYKLADNVRMLAPSHREFHITDDAEFTASYRGRLDKFGVDRIRRLLFHIHHDAGIGNGLVLLCYEDVWAGEKCHRQDFAAWWLDRTGEQVHELPSRSTKADAGMQMKLDEAVQEVLGV